jgi:DnaK suppressor protein
MKNKTEQKQKEIHSEGNQPESKEKMASSVQERYSDEELKEFKELIISKLDEAIEDYELLKGTLRLLDDHGTDDTSPTFKLLEDAADVTSKEETAQLASRQEKFIQHLQNALIRVENKSYGICRVTGKLIPKERLRSVPHATMSIDAKRDNSPH